MSILKVTAYKIVASDRDAIEHVYDFEKNDFEMIHNSKRNQIYETNLNIALYVHSVLNLNDFGFGYSKIVQVELEISLDLNDVISEKTLFRKD